MKAGQRVVIIDDVQSDEWWFARDPVSGREGVVPATYGKFSLQTTDLS
jgi:putative methionine-R-sulfoxide reductase with GAF domain